MTTYIIRRLLMGVLVLFLVSLIVFFSLRLMPGDPVLIYVAGQQGGSSVTPEMLVELRHEYGLDKSIPVQYANWVKGIFHGDLGNSIRSHEPVAKSIRRSIPITLVLGFSALIISTILGVFLGLVAAIRRGSWIDTVVTLLSYIGLVIPVFVVAYLLIYVLILKLHVGLPVTGYHLPWTGSFKSSLLESILPIICLGTVPIAITARQMRSSVLEVNNMDYVRTAWSKGLRERTIVTRHVLKNSLIPVLTMVGMGISMIFGGSVIEETIFAIPGMGQLLVKAVLNRDYVVIQGCTLILAAIIVFVNLIVDISYGWLDPRIRYG
jgi:peptide/nickel transport system permease protein